MLHSEISFVERGDCWEELSSDAVGFARELSSENMVGEAFVSVSLFKLVSLLLFLFFFCVEAENKRTEKIYDGVCLLVVD